MSTADSHPPGTTSSDGPVRVLFATGDPARLPELIAAFGRATGDAPLCVVSETEPPAGEWIPTNNDVRAALRGRTIQWAALSLDPLNKNWALRLTALWLAAWRLLFFYEPTLDHFMLRPRSIPSILKWIVWRLRNDLRPQVNVVFASAGAAHVGELIEHLKQIDDTRPLYVVSKFPPPEGEWIRYDTAQGFWANRRAIHAALRPYRIWLAAVYLDRHNPFWRVRWVGFLETLWRMIFFIPTLDHFMLRPRSAKAMVRYLVWSRLNDLRPPVHVVFATRGTERVKELIAAIRRIDPAPKPLYVVSMFRPPEGEWIRYRLEDSWWANYRRVREALKDHRIYLGAMLLGQHPPDRKVKWIAFRMAWWRMLYFIPTLDHFMLRPRSARALLDYAAWRLKNDLRQPVKVVWASCEESQLPRLLSEAKQLDDDFPIYVVSEFRPPEGVWIPFNLYDGFWKNRRRVRQAINGKNVRFAFIYLASFTSYWSMRVIALLSCRTRLRVFNLQMDSFLLAPSEAGKTLRFFWWRLRELFIFGGLFHTWWRRLNEPTLRRRPVAFWKAERAGERLARRRITSEAVVPKADDLEDGISVVIPSRDGNDLLARLLPGVHQDLSGTPYQIIVVDNGSAEPYRAVGVITVVSIEPLSFAAAVNRGIREARFRHVCLLNNDMVIEPGFFRALRGAFRAVPDLFCATAQIFFPPGVRREETGKAVMPFRRPGQEESTDFPLLCQEPLAGEDHTYVLYGSGGCSLYDTAKLRALDGFSEIFAPAYVEDCDLGWRAWRQNWPTVFVAGAKVTHWHRSTTAKHFSEEQLSLMVERNWLRFLANAVGDSGTLRRLWREATMRLNVMAYGDHPPELPLAALEFASTLEPKPLAKARLDEDRIPALGAGDLAHFPGAARSGKPVVLVATCYAPFPLSHGGAVRMYNLMRRAARDFDVVCVHFVDEFSTPPPETLAISVEVVQVRRHGSHYRRRQDVPHVVEEFDSPVMRAVLRQLVRKWQPAIAQLEYTQMAQYAADCAPARTLLVEHDITLDLYDQLVSEGGPMHEVMGVYEQYQRWVAFENDAWRRVDRVVVMSEKDHARVPTPNAVVLANGVDLERFQPSADAPEPGRLLFISAFHHLPNLLALDWFLREVWPLLDGRCTLHVIAGRNHEYYRNFYREKASLNLEQAGIEVEGFVSEIRPAYRRAEIVIAPLLASAGTNIKIMEAMAMGKAIVSTPSGVNGLHLDAG
nr:glycosyltransferase [Bryobacter sp.]